MFYVLPVCCCVWCLVVCVAAASLVAGNPIEHTGNVCLRCLVVGVRSARGGVVGQGRGDFFLPCCLAWPLWSLL